MAAEAIHIPLDENRRLAGDLALPPEPRGLVLFAHGSGSSRHSERNRAVARALNEARLATLLIDLLTSAEEEAERETRHLRFDIPLLAERVGAAIAWRDSDPRLADLPLGLFGASTGAAAALVAAARQPGSVAAVVSRGGRPDLADEALRRVVAPTLLLVGGDDRDVLELNRRAARAMTNAKKAELVVIPGAGHLFAESGKLEEVARLAGDWFAKHFAAAARALHQPSVESRRDMPEEKQKDDENFLGPKSYAVGQENEDYGESARDEELPPPDDGLSNVKAPKPGHSHETETAIGQESDTNS